MMTGVCGCHCPKLTGLNACQAQLTFGPTDAKNTRIWPAPADAKARIFLQPSRNDTSRPARTRGGRILLLDVIKCFLFYGESPCSRLVFEYAEAEAAAADTSVALPEDQEDGGRGEEGDGGVEGAEGRGGGRRLRARVAAARMGILPWPGEEGDGEE
uniref:Uncharacterized protein n=1 Tax=Leersia perrieri TaxID=77586 RepID=A0A0D9WSP6_9ORYZ